MARIRSNGVRLMLVERADRLARDLMVGEVLLAEVPQARRRGGCRGFRDRSDGWRRRPDARVARLRKRRATGRCEGRKPFGAKPGEADVLALMRKLRRKPQGGERLSYDGIAARLNAEAVPIRTGNAWSGATVRGILKRDV